MTRFFADMGTDVVGTVASAKAPALAGLSVDRVVVGDLEDLEVMARNAKAELIVANSHGADIAARLGVPLLRAGFPLYDVYGGPAQCWIGYGGSRQTLFHLANLPTAFHQEIPPYRSQFWQGTAREQEMGREQETGARPC